MPQRILVIPYMDCAESAALTPSFPGSQFWPFPGQNDVALLNLGISTFKTEKNRAKRISPTVFLSANRLGCLETTTNPYHIRGGILAATINDGVILYLSPTVQSLANWVWAGTVFMGCGLKLRAIAVIDVIEQHVVTQHHLPVRVHPINPLEVIALAHDIQVENPARRLRILDCAGWRTPRSGSNARHRTALRRSRAREVFPGPESSGRREPGVVVRLQASSGDRKAKGSRGVS